MAAKKKPQTAAQKKVKKVMEEWELGKLHSGGKKGPIVKDQKQAVAIALRQSGQARPRGAGKKR